MNRSLLGCAVAVGVLTGCGEAEPVAGDDTTTTVEAPLAVVQSSAHLLKANCQPLWLRDDEMIFNTRLPNGHWDAMVGDGACEQGVALLPAWRGHRGATDVTPDGRWVLLETDYDASPGQSWAEPGKGFHNDLELLDRVTGRLTRLTTGRKGTIWGRLHPSGSKVTWAEMLKTPLESNLWHNLLGTWELHVADITAQGTLVNERSWHDTTGPGRDSEPGDEGFLETYGWLGDRIMFATDQGVEANGWGDWLNAQLWTIPDTLATGPTRVSRSFSTWWGGQELAYHEFMHLAEPHAFPENGTWIFTSILRDANSGMDLWRMRPDGSGRQRLTFFNGKQVSGQWQQVTGYPAPKYTVVGGIAVDHANPRRIVTGLAGDANATTLDAWEIDF